MEIIRRMNAYAQERFALQELEHRYVPSATDGAAPIIFNAINQRSCRKYVARAEITHGTQACGVFHLRIAGGALRFIAKQPRRRHKTSRLKTVRTEFIARAPGRCDQWKELRCRNCAHLGIFGFGEALNKAKASIKE